jgi:hypothetical protein
VTTGIVLQFAWLAALLGFALVLLAVSLRSRG